MLEQFRDFLYTTWLCTQWQSSQQLESYDVWGKALVLLARYQMKVWCRSLSTTKLTWAPTTTDYTRSLAHDSRRRRCHHARSMEMRRILGYASVQSSKRRRQWVWYDSTVLTFKPAYSKYWNLTCWWRVFAATWEICRGFSICSLIVCFPSLR